MLESCFLIRLGRLLKEARATLGVLLTDLSATSRSDPPGTGSYYGKLGSVCLTPPLPHPDSVYIKYPLSRYYNGVWRGGYFKMSRLRDLQAHLVGYPAV